MVAESLIPPDDNRQWLKPLIQIARLWQALQQRPADFASIWTRWMRYKCALGLRILPGARALMLL